MRFNHIQTLRFFAATAVVIFHSLAAGKLYLNTTKSSIFELFNHGYFGVDLFFVISGFIIYYTTHKTNRRPVTFLARRYERVVPIYWGATLAMIFFAVALPSAFKDVGWLNCENIIKSLFFVKFTDMPFFPIVNVGWTLEFEMLFYLSVCLILCFRKEAWSILSVVFSLSVLLGCGYRPSAENPYYEFFTNPLLLEFIFGIIVARLICNKVLYKWELVAVIAAALAVFLTEPYSNLIPDNNSRVIIAGVPAAVIVFLAAYFNAKQLSPSWLEAGLAALGDASYSIYLVQAFTLSFLCKLWLKLLPSGPLDLLIAVAASVTVMAGYIVYHFIERPMLRFSHTVLA